MANKLIEAYQLVTSVAKAMRYGGSILRDTPELVKSIIKNDYWKEFTVTQTGETVTFKTFEEFVSSPAPKGLAADIQTLKNICRDNVEALDAIDRVTKQKQGRPNKNIDNINVSSTVPDGTSAASALRRLRKDRPDLHSAVLSGAKSPHAAMIEAGFRKYKLSVAMEPAAVASAVRKHFTREELAELISLLREGET